LSLTFFAFHISLLDWKANAGRTTRYEMVADIIAAAQHARIIRIAS
jgi:hypothetical protein